MIWSIICQKAKVWINRFNADHLTPPDTVLLYNHCPCDGNNFPLEHAIATFSGQVKETAKELELEGVDLVVVPETGQVFCFSIFFVV